MRGVPVVQGPPLLGLNHQLLRDPVGLFLRAYQRHGDVVELDLGVAGSMFGVFHPDGVRLTLQRGRRVHRALLRELLGKGLFTSPSGADWLRRRRLLQPLFRPERLAAMVPLLLRPVDEFLDRRWRVGATVDTAEEMKRMTVAMMIDATFGSGDGFDRATAREALGFLLPYVDDQLFTLVKPPRSWPTPSNRRYRAELATVRRVIAEQMARWRPDPDAEVTFLDGLMRTRLDETGRDFTDEEIVDEVLSIFIAGTETTGTALTWALHLISRHPQVGDALRAEVGRVVGDRAPTAADLAGLSWPEAVVQEALRLYPPAWALRRVIDEPLEVSPGTVLPAGSRLIVSPYVTHRHREVWEDPEAFAPARWLPPRQRERPRFSYFPFGAGAHQCVGNLFARLEGELILTRAAQRFRLLPAVDTPVRTRPTIALAPVPAPQLLVAPV